MNPERWPDQWPAGARRIIDSGTIGRALDRQAGWLDEQLDNHHTVTLMALMNGGMYPAIELGRRLHRPFLMDHLHATRYRGRTEGDELSWGRWPKLIEGTIVLVDDIFDEGWTMKAVRERLLKDGAEQVLTVALTVKNHDRGLPRDWVDHAALEVPDRYVFGCGMDWHGYWRQLDEIWAI